MTPTHRAARWYASIGWNPLPSRSDVKGPAVEGYAPYRDGTPIPRQWLDDWKAGNIQVCCGVPWGLAVVDLDNLGRLAWKQWCRQHGCPPTWTVRTGGGGIHLYFTLPAGLDACPSRKVWGVPKGDSYAKHQFVEILGDKALVIAPPSTHVDTGRPYEFLPGLGPRDLKRPAIMPQWVLDLPPIPTRKTPRNASTLLHSERSVHCRGLGMIRPNLDRSATMTCLSGQEILALATSWGVVFTGRISGGIWAECRAVGREDLHPSAGVNLETGVYSEPFVRALSLLDLAVELNVASDWRDALRIVEEATR